MPSESLSKVCRSSWAWFSRCGSAYVMAPNSADCFDLGSKAVRETSVDSIFAYPKSGFQAGYIDICIHWEKWAPLILKKYWYEFAIIYQLYQLYYEDPFDENPFAIIYQQNTALLFVTPGDSIHFDHQIGSAHRLANATDRNWRCFCNKNRHLHIHFILH